MTTTNIERIRDGIDRTPRLEYSGTLYGVRIYTSNSAGTIHGGTSCAPPTEMLAAILDYANRVRADDRGEAALVLSSAEYEALAAELQEAREYSSIDDRPEDTTT